ncbi:hypothetical protein BH24ACI2_BH24ACI2_00900 [soil metagenome]
MKVISFDTKLNLTTARIEESERLTFDESKAALFGEII